MYTSEKYLRLLFFILFFLHINSSTAASNQNKNNHPFAFNLFAQIKNNNNIIISPYGLSTLLGCLSTVSAGNTKQQLVQVLQLKGNENIQTLCTPAHYLKSFIINKHDGQMILNLAAAFWRDKSLQYKETFLDSIKNDSGIHFFTVDFKNHTNLVLSQMNDWVKKNTEGHITNFFSKDVISPATLFVMINAIYFKGQWQYPFDLNKTENQFFFLSKKEGVNIPMMNQTHEFNYYEDNLQQVIILPYTLNKLAFAVFLPKANHSLVEIENTLPPHFTSMMSQLKNTLVTVTLPKFNLESTFNLKSLLQQLGLTDMFIDKANFTPLTNSRLFVSDVIQKAFIQVDEEGTQAAAGTAISGIGGISHPIIFNANHPFVFLIFDPQTKTIFFMGKLIQLSAKGGQTLSAIPAYASQLAKTISTITRSLGGSDISGIMSFNDPTINLKNNLEDALSKNKLLSTPWGDLKITGKTENNNGVLIEIANVPQEICRLVIPNLKQREDFVISPNDPATCKTPTTNISIRFQVH